MKTNGQKIASGIGMLIMIVGLILGVVYVLTGNTFDGKFVGHFDRKTFEQSEMPEVLAFASMGVFFIWMIIWLITYGISQKGMSKPEKKEASKEFGIFFIGLMIGVISVVVMAVLAPKQDIDFEAKSTTWYWIVLVVEIISAITLIAGFVQGLKNSKQPLINKSENAQIRHDEF